MTRSPVRWWVAGGERPGAPLIDDLPRHVPGWNLGRVRVHGGGRVRASLIRGKAPRGSWSWGFPSLARNRLVVEDDRRWVLCELGLLGFVPCCLLPPLPDNAEVWPRMTRQRCRHPASWFATGRLGGARFAADQRRGTSSNSRLRAGVGRTSRGVCGRLCRPPEQPCPEHGDLQGEPVRGVQGVEPGERLDPVESVGHRRTDRWILPDAAVATHPESK